jgi:hypothetical protein
MKTAATINVTVPESRELNLVLPPEVPPGQARLVVLVEEATDRVDDSNFDEVELIEKQGVLVARSTVPKTWPLDAFDHRRLREDRVRNTTGR